MAEYEVVISTSESISVVEFVQPGQPQVDEVYLPVPGPPGAVAAAVFGESPSGLLNGSNATFTTAFAFLPETVQVFCNGVLLRIIDDYQLSGSNTIQLTFSPLSVEKISVNYIKQ